MITLFSALATTSTQIAKIRDFISATLPPGFPIKFDLPVFPTVSVRVRPLFFKPDFRALQIRAAPVPIHRAAVRQSAMRCYGTPCASCTTVASLSTVWVRACVGACVVLLGACFGRWRLALYLNSALPCYLSTPPQAEFTKVALDTDTLTRPVILAAQ